MSKTSLMIYVAEDRMQKAKKPRITLSNIEILNSCPEKIIAAKIAKFFIHCLGLSSLIMLNIFFLIGIFYSKMQEKKCAANKNNNHKNNKSLSLTR